MNADAVTPDALADRPEGIALSAYLRALDAGKARHWFSARYRGECAVTRAVIKPYMQIVAIGDQAFVRQDAVQILDQEAVRRVQVAYLEMKPEHRPAPEKEREA